MNEFYESRMSKYYRFALTCRMLEVNVRRTERRYLMFDTAIQKWGHRSKEFSDALFYMPNFHFLCVWIPGKFVWIREYEIEPVH